MECFVYGVQHNLQGLVQGGGSGKLARKASKDSVLPVLPVVQQPVKLLLQKLFQGFEAEGQHQDVEDLQLEAVAPGARRQDRC